VTRSSPDSAYAFEQLEPAAPRPGPAPGQPLAADAATTLADAQAEAERIREEAREAGRDEGFRIGMAEATHTLRPAAEALAQAATALRAEHAAAGEVLERHAVDLALAIAEKALQSALEVQPERVAEVIKGAMRLLVEREDVVLHVNPVDVDIVRDALAEVADGRHVEVIEERRVSRGGAVLRTVVGEVDARLETKLERAAEVLRSELES
jgi:flagellar assembly protein FliH